MDGKGTKARIISGIALKSLFNLAVLKLTAVYFGTTGIALLAHLQNLTGIIIHLGREGVSRSLCTIIQRRQLSHPHRQSLIISGLLFSLLLQLVSLLIIVIFRKYFLQHFPLEISYLTFFLIYGMAVMLFGLCVYFSAIIFGLGRLKYYFFINTAGALLIVVALLIGIDRNGLMYYLFAYVVGQSLNFLVILPFILKFGLLKLGKASISFHSMREVSGFFLMAISVLFFSKITDFVVRDYAMSYYGLDHTGLWQAVVKISDTYIELFIATIGSVYYPKVRSLIFDSYQLRKYLKDMLAVVIPVSIVGLALLYFFRDTAIDLVYSPEFKQARYLFKFQLTGDFFSIISYMLTYVIIAQARISLLVLLQGGSAIMYIALVVLLSQWHSIEAIPMAHAIRFGLFLMVLIVLNKRMLF